MKKITFLILFISVAAIVDAQIKGNVFWKYNDYVGNKPDAGAAIILFDDAANYQKTLADVNGNFEFDGLADGQYFLIVISKNTTEPIDRKIYQLSEFKQEIQHSGFLDMTKTNNELNDYLETDKNIIIKEMDLNHLKNDGSKGKERKKIIKEKEEELTILKANQAVLLHKIINNIEYAKNTELSIPAINMLAGSYGQKSKFLNIIVKNAKSNRVVIDFGITYL